MKVVTMRSLFKETDGKKSKKRRGIGGKKSKGASADAGLQKKIIPISTIVTAESMMA